MQTARLSFQQIPHTTRLFLDYLYDFPKVQAFYPQDPGVRDWREARARLGSKDRAIGAPTEASGDAVRRSAVADVLDRQNRSWGAGAATLSNLQRLRAGASVVVTGQQVGLFGGPLYCLLKALTAVKLAAEATSQGIDTVPVFWLAAEDHDLAEVNHIYLASQSRPLRIEVSSKGKADAPVGSITFGPEIVHAVDEVAAALLEYRAGGPSVAGDAIIAALRECYAPGETFATAYAKLWTRLTGRWGLIILDASDPELDRIAAPLYRQAIECAGELTDSLLARGKELVSAGYHAQVKVTPSSTLLFSMSEGVRRVIHRGHPHSGHPDFTAGNQRFAAAELRRVADESPELLSPNALFRPVVQDYLLPTLAYVGGGAEVAYFGQSAVVFDQLLGRRTAIMPRISATLIESKAEKLLAKYALHWTRTFEGPSELAVDLARHQLPQDVQAVFGAALTSMQQIGRELEATVEKVDATLAESARRATANLHHVVSSLNSRAARAEVRKNALFSRHADLLCGALYPFGGLQERTLSCVEFVARHGFDWLEELSVTLSADTPDHQIVQI